MGLLNWLFSKPEADISWNQKVQNKNSTIVVTTSRTEDNDRYRAIRKKEWETEILKREKMIQNIDSLISTDSKLNLTKLRGPFTKIENNLRQIDRLISQYKNVGVTPELIKLTSHHKTKLLKLQDFVGGKISELESKRKPRKAPISASTLSPKLATTMDKLIQKFNDAPVLSRIERERLYGEFRYKISERMLEGQSYRKASEIPDYFNQDEDSFRKQMKDVSQELQWQCKTVSEAFDAYQTRGILPAPYYPMRIAILLRKAKDHDRERIFLAAHCRHFPSENTGKYAAYTKLVKRAEKIDALNMPTANSSNDISDTDNNIRKECFTDNFGPNF